MTTRQQYRVGIYADYQAYAMVLSGVDSENQLWIHDLRRNTVASSEKIQNEIEDLAKGYHIGKVYMNTLKPLFEQLRQKYAVEQENFVIEDELFLLNGLFAEEKIIISEKVVTQVEKERASFTNLKEINHLIYALILAVKELKYLDYNVYTTGPRELQQDAKTWWDRGGNQSMESILRDY